MVVLAQNSHKSHAFNICGMVLEDNGDNTQGDEVFLQNAHAKIEARLTEGNIAIDVKFIHIVHHFLRESVICFYNHTYIFYTKCLYIS